MNSTGRSENLRPDQPGNSNARRHGVFSEREMAPYALEIADALMSAPHTVLLDRLAAEEIGRIKARIEAIDRDLDERGLTDRHGNARSLLDLRIRLSRRLESWLKEFGATPASRVGWVEQLSRAEIVRAAVRAELEEGARLVATAEKNATGECTDTQEGDDGPLT